MRYERVKVKRDTNTVHNHAVRPWEIPILEFIFEDGNVERTGDFVESTQDYPAAASEMDRLVRAYGADSQSGVPYASSVFGNARAGVRSLEKLIAEAKEDDKAASKAPPAKATAKPRGRREAADSLLS
jgi:hypothetical protein